MNIISVIHKKKRYELLSRPNLSHSVAKVILLFALIIRVEIRLSNKDEKVTIIMKCGLYIVNPTYLSVKSEFNRSGDNFRLIFSG